MSIRLQAGLRLFLALLGATLLLALLPLLFAFAQDANSPAHWFDFQPPSTAWQAAHSIQASVVVTDSDGLSNAAAYRLSVDGLSWSAWMTDNLQVAGVVSTTRALTITQLAVTDGVQYLQYIITDSLGTAELSPQARIQVDTTPPSAPEQAQLTPSGWQTATDVSWTADWQNPSDLSGVAAACYKIGAAPTDIHDGTCVAEDAIQQIAGITPPAEGSFDFYLWLRDAAGNSSITHTTVITDGIQWDKTQPGIFMDVFGNLGHNNWYTDTVSASFLASDGQSGIAEVAYQLDGQGWQPGRSAVINTDGRHTLVARAIDVAGNSKSTPTREIKLDRTPPTTTVTSSGAPDALGWYETPVTLTLQAEDATSGVAETWQQLDADPWQHPITTVVQQDGQHQFRYYSIDEAGNTEPIQEKNVWIDQLPPVTSYAVLSPGGPSNGWYNQPVTVTLVPVDEGIGVDQTYYRINGSNWMTGETFILTDSNNYDIDFYSVDKLGHVETAASIPDGVHIDTVPPLAPHPLEVQPGSWTNVNDFNLLFALPPDLSGIAGAYVKVGEPPLTPTNGDWHPGANNTLNHVQVPDEGAYTAYVWLQDNAGNVDHGNYGVWDGDLRLKYDATPPTTNLAVAGVIGKNGWYTSPITVTFLPTDALSGPAATMVSIDGNAPVITDTLYLTQQDKHTVRFFSFDQAGNQEETQLTTLRVDYQAPDRPQNIQVQPFDWTHTNTFTITWDNPYDVSGIGAAYYTLGAPPRYPQDGTRISPTGVATGISAPSEGAWDLYLWLEDEAGNVTLDSVIKQPGALRYDATPPSSNLSVLEGELGNDNWYVSPVKVRIQPQDSGSGPAGVRYRINNGAWITAKDEAIILMDSTGRFDLAYQAIDVAGNLETIQHAFFKIDIDPPQPSFLANERYQRQTNFLVTWQGSDQLLGSGLKTFELQSKDGRNGAWEDWGVFDATEIQHRYYGNYGHRYFFRIRAQDSAGNRSKWIEMPWGIYVDKLQDGDFPAGDFGLWQHGGPLVQSVIAAPGPYADAPTFVAQLGSPDYGANNDFSQPGTVPIGAAAITQTVRIPGPDVLDRPMLTFWYRIRTYDADYSERYQRLYDTMDVRLFVGDTAQLVFRDGQPYDQWLENEGSVLADLGWRQAFIPIPRNMIGENVRISIENWNRNDQYLNTWTQVTDIRVWEPYQVFLPQLIGGSAAQPASTQEVLPVLRPSHTSRLR